MLAVLTAVEVLPPNLSLSEILLRVAEELEKGPTLLEGLCAKSGLKCAAALSSEENNLGNFHKLFRLFQKKAGHFKREKEGEPLSTSQRRYRSHRHGKRTRWLLSQYQRICVVVCMAISCRLGDCVCSLSPTGRLLKQYGNSRTSTATGFVASSKKCPWPRLRVAARPLPSSGPSTPSLLCGGSDRLATRYGHGAEVGTRNGAQGEKHSC